MDQTNMIYLNHHKKTKLCQLCIETIKEDPWLQTCDLEQSYQTIYDFLGISYEDRFILSPSWEKAVDDVLFEIYVQQIRKEGKTHIIAFNLEGTPIRSSLKKLEELGVIVRLIDVKEDGTIDIQALKYAISPRTALICFSWANGLNGIIQPVEEIEKIAQEKTIKLYVDATYVLGKMYLPLNDRLIDYMTFSGHVIHALESSAGIFVRKEDALTFMNREIDPTSLTTLSIACRQSLLFIDQMGLVVTRLRNLFEKSLISKFPSTQIYGKNGPRLCNVSCLAFEKVHTEPLLYALEKKGVFAGVFNEEFLSFSLSRYTTKQEIEQAADLIIKEVELLQTLSVDL